MMGLVAALGTVAACDRPVPDGAPVPAGEIQPARVSAVAINTTTIVPNNDIVGNPNDIVLDPPADPTPGDCRTNGCPTSLDPCNAYVCNSTTLVCDLVATNEGGKCDDGNACTNTDTCTKGVCQPGAPTTCPPPADQCHDQGTCDPKSGACSNPPKAYGTGCSDGKTCTVGDKCTGGVCAGTVSCPGDQCHDAGQ